MNFEYSLNTNDEKKKLIIRDFSISREDICLGNPYNSSAIIEVVSYNFKGEGSMIFDIKHYNKFISELKDMRTKMRGIAIFRDVSDRSYIQMEINKYGRIVVSGLVFDDISEQSLSFSFETDQTAIA